MSSSRKLVRRKAARGLKKELIKWLALTLRPPNVHAYARGGRFRILRQARQCYHQDVYP